VTERYCCETLFEHYKWHGRWGKWISDYKTIISAAHCLAKNYIQFWKETKEIHVCINYFLKKMHTIIAT
jgi:hypothetical protein